MKVLLIHGYHAPVGGADKVYLNTGELLSNRGHEVIYFSFRNKVNIDSLNEKYFLDEPSKFQSVINFFYNKQAAVRIENLIFKEKPDIAHLHSFWGGLTPSILFVLRKYNIPIVHTVHDYNLICPVSTSTDNKGNICEACKGKYFYLGAIKRCHKGSFCKSSIIAASLLFRRKYFDPIQLIDGWIFVSWFTYYKHLKFMPHLINSDTINLYNFNPDPQVKNTIKSDRKYFLYFGRLSREKGLSTLIMAFSQVRHLKLVIAGTGPQEFYLKDMVQKLGLDNIEFIGFKSGDELKSIINNASFNIVPSEWWENNPMSIIEAYSLGIPVIGANVGGIPEIVVDGETGYLFDMKNVDQLAKIISKANALSTIEYNTMSTCAFDFALQKFNKDQYISSLEEYYKKHINKNSKL
jgi:glycosyltransferase involved in cell wall biosynthesis